MKHPIYCYLDTPEGHRQYYKLTHRVKLLGGYYYIGAQIDRSHRVLDPSVLWSVPHFNRCIGGGVAKMISRESLAEAGC